MPEEAAHWSREYGGDPSFHVARQLTSDLIESSDLVIALAREHRSAVAKLLPRATRYTFTLRELARILSGTRRAVSVGDSSVSLPAPGDFSSWVALASVQRGYFAAPPANDEVIDPYGREAWVYRESAEQIEPAVSEVVGSLLG